MRTQGEAENPALFASTRRDWRARQVFHGEPCPLQVLEPVCWPTQVIKCAPRLRIAGAGTAEPR